MLRGLSREEECVWINKKAIKKEEKKQIKATLKSLVKSKEISNEFVQNLIKYNNIIISIK